MVEEIVTATAKKKTDKTVANEAETLRIGEETETYVTDEKTRQKLLDLLTAKVNQNTALTSSSIKPSISPIAVSFFLVVLVIVIVIVSKQNMSENGRKNGKGL